MDILNIKENQFLLIKDEKYKVLNMTKYIEKSSFWIEYKLLNTVSSKYYYLNVETSGKATLYEIIDTTNIEPQMTINYKGEDFVLFEKGQGSVISYFGLTDIAIGDVDEYYEYMSKNNSERILSIEKWKYTTEISLGELLKKNNIKILNEFDL